ncbi:Mediator complex, subunit Med13 [Niveomyces insectorum RCEF 264]|uniref:Mediator of RNA polymerase II transcription subunit 13 n=1 Tax=Niveomyces insectorum RCEF 264 TaxID=1081102 RepID=A0A167TZ50_9HYPO|nr:Mediator complex, subunit Med13 [Niveomyces insectorum RCEF 264]
MDVGEYETNTLVVSHIASVAFRVYRHVATSSSSVHAFSSTDIEKALRTDGHLVFADSRRRGIWCFRLLRKDGTRIGSPAKSELGATIAIGPHRLSMVDEGAFEPSSLLKGRPTITNAIKTPNSSSSSSGLSAIDSASKTAINQQFGLPPPSATPTLSQASTVLTNATVPPDAETAPAGSRPPGTDTAEQRTFPAVPAKVVYNFFLSSVLASLSSAYCSKANAIALNSRTFLLPPLDPLWDGEESSRADRKSLVATLRVCLTTAGALLVSLSHSILQGMGCSTWACYDHVPPAGASVLTAPWGKLATIRDVYPPLPPDEAGPYASTTSGGTRLLPSVPQAWKNFVAQMLEMRGTSPSVMRDSSWLRVEFLLEEETGSSKPVVILWPSVLCFWSLENPSATVALFQRLDPLADVREAYLEELRGEDVASKPLEAKEDEDVFMEDAPTVSSTGKGSQSDGPSPLGMRNSTGLVSAAAAAAAAGTVYPTPPDGVSNPVGVTPTFDGSVSSPGNAVGTVAPADSDAPATERSLATEGTFGDFWQSNELKREEHDQPFIAEPENLFGEMGVDMFGDDVTDADFNFFDKKPDAAGVPLPGASDAATTTLGETDIDTTMTQASPQTKVEGQSPAEKPRENLAISSFADGKSNEILGESVAQGRPEPSMFAKPELKHARSNLNDETRDANFLFKTSANGGPVYRTKRPPSPFNAMTVFKRVRTLVAAKRAQSGWAKQSTLARHGNRFEGLRFTDFMLQNNKKYEQNGKFSFVWPHPEADMAFDMSSATSPTAFRRPVKKKPGLEEQSPAFSALVSSITRNLKSSSLRPQSPPLVDNSEDTSSGSSGPDSSSSDDTDDDEPLAASMAQRKLKARMIAEAVPLPEAATELSRVYSEGVWDFPITRFFADPMPPQTELAYTDDDIADVAQILTQQITRATIRSGFDEDSGQDLQHSKLRQTLLQRTRYSIATLQSCLPPGLHDATRCSLKLYLEVQDIPLLVQPSRLHPRPPPGSEQLRTNFFPVPTPHVELRRNESALSIMPTAVEFWEVLGLEPLHGAKDIKAVCLYPNYDGLAEEVGNFIGRMRIVYESLRLGSHEPLSDHAAVSNGMASFDASMPYAASSGSATGRSDFLGADQMHKLAQALAAEDTPSKSLLVYHVYCADVTNAIVDACLAFQRLSQLYEIAVTSRNTEPNDLVLQLIPTSFLASSTCLVVPTPTDLFRLSLEVYDRCASPRGPRPSPAFLLEQPPSRMLDLKLSATPSVDVQRENSCIHVAYAQSADNRWVTAAWTDSSGWRQFSAAYRVARKGMPPTNSFAAVAQEMWENTCALVASLKVHWRAVITKCGTMEQDEVQVWTELAKVESRASISVTLVAVDTRPSLELLPPVVTVPPTALSLLSAATPAPTPQASVFSPEQSGNPVTPVANTSFGNPTTPAGTPAGAPTPVTPSAAATTNTGTGAGGGGGGPNSPAVANTSGANANSDPSAKLAAAGADPNTVAEIDGNVVLVDITDSTWGAVAAHRLNTSSTWVDVRPALVSGYLVKRGGMGRDDPPVVLEVNVIRAEGSPRGYESLVREILSSFRGLGTLARARGILDGERDVRPWHVAAAERSAKALCQWM